VTLIAAFSCSDGVVICADSQETLGLPLPSDDYAEYCVNVDKIEPRQVGHYDVIIGGAGHSALVEGFTEALSDQIETWPASLDSGGLKAKLRTVLLDYHQHEVAVCPARDKEIHFLICIKDRHSASAEVHTFLTRTTSITRVKTYAIVGWEEAIYRHDIERHYKENQQSTFSMLVGVHVLLLAGKTSNNVGGPTKIVVAASSGFRELKADDVKELEHRINNFDAALDALRLRLCDTSIPLDRFQQHISDFATVVEDLRFTLTADLILTHFHRLKDVKTIEDLPLVEDILNNPYLRLPPLEESKQALRASWEYTVRNRRNPRYCGIASWNLAHAAHLLAEILSGLYTQGILSRDQKDKFAERLLEINRNAKSALDKRGELSSGASVDAFYADLGEKVAYPLLALADDLFDELFSARSDDPMADRVVDGLYGGVLSVFTVAFLQRWAEPVPEEQRKQLEDGTNGEGGSVISKKE
jgi:hypothetical protein